MGIMLTGFLYYFTVNYILQELFLQGVYGICVLFNENLQELDN